MSSRLRKLSLALGLVIVFAGSAAAQSIQVEGLTEEDINTSYQDNGVRFTTDYLNKTVEYKDLFVPKYLHDDLNNFKAQYQGQGNQEKLQVQFKFKQAQKDGDGDMPGFLSQYQYQATQQVNPGQTQFQVQSSLDVDDLGNGTSLEEDADYDFQSQQNNEQLQIDGSLNRKLDGQQLLNDAPLDFSKRAGEFAFDSGVIKPEVSSHYEHLIVNHTVRSSVSPDYGRSVNTTETVFSGNETQRIPVTGDIEQLSAGKVRQSVTHDNLYEDQEVERLVVAHTPRTNISGVDFGGLNHSDRYSVNYSDLVEPELNAANISTVRIQDPSDYEFAAWNVTYPADSQRTVSVSFSQPVYNPLTDNPENYEFSYFSYIVGSVATFKTDTSSEWQGGSFSGTQESSGSLRFFEPLQNFTHNSDSAIDYNVPVDGNYEIDIWGAGGGGGRGRNIEKGTPFTQGGNGGFISGTASLSSSDSLDLYVAEGGKGEVSRFDFDTDGGWGFHSGGFGESSDEYSAGGGGGSSSVRLSDGTLIAAADGGGGGGAQSATNGGFDYNCGGGGGGGGGGLGGEPTCSFSSENGGDAQGNGKGGDGGGASDGDGNAEPGNPGGARHNSNVFSASTKILGGGMRGGVNASTVEFASGKNAKIQINAPYTVGKYTSAVFSASEEKIYENVTVSNFAKNGGTIDITVETSNDGFSTVLESDTVSSSELSSSGTQTVDLALSQGATDVRYNISLDKGSSSPSIDSIEIDGKTANKPPQITQAEFIDDRQAGITDLDFTLDDRTESDISGFTAAFSASTFTNSTLRGGVSLPFSDTVSVSDFPGASGSRSVDISETDSGLQERSGFGHTLGTQRIERQVTISNGDSNSIDYSLTTDLPGDTVVQGQSFTGTISGSSSVTETSITEDDFITGETESTFDRFSDTGFNHGEDTQQIVNQTQLTADNSRSFSFTGVDISGQCSQTGSADVGSGTGVTVTTDCNRPTFQVDKISQSTSSEFEDTSFNHDLGTQGIAKDKTLTEDTGSFSFSGINVSEPSISGTIQNGGQRQVDLSAGGSVTETYNATGDFITGESEVADRFEDAGFDQTEDTQQFINETDLIVDNTQSHSFTGVDISSQCSSTTSTDVPSGTGVTATDQCNVDTFSGDFISTSVSSEFGDASVEHTLDSQGVAKQKNLTNTRGFEFSGVTVSEPSLSGTVQNAGQRDVTLAGGETRSEFFNATGDFISNERENTFIEAQNTSKVSSVASQAIFNQTELVVDNAKSFQFGSVDISNRCSLDAAADVPAGSSAQVTTRCNNRSFTVDRVEETNFEFEPAASEIVLGVNYTGRRPVEFENTAANVNFSGLDTAPGVNTPGACTQTNASTVGVNAGNAKNKSVRFDCDPGTPGTPQKEIIPNQPATGFETVEYKTTAFVETNETKNRPIIWQIDKSNLNDFNEREGGTLEATVDGQTRNVSVFDFPDTVEVRVDTDFGNSSLESGSHDMEVRYSYTVDSPGGGGGGGGAPEEEGRTAVTFDPANVTARPNSTGTSDFTIQNQLAEPLSVTVEVPDNNECRGFYLLNGSERSQRQTYNVEGSTNSITGFRDVEYGFDAAADFVETRSCEARVGLPASTGGAGDLVLTAEPETGLLTEFVVFVEQNFGYDLRTSYSYEIPEVTELSLSEDRVEKDVAATIRFTGLQVLMAVSLAVVLYGLYRVSSGSGRE